MTYFNILLNHFISVVFASLRLPSSFSVFQLLRRRGAWWVQQDLSFHLNQANGIKTEGECGGGKNDTERVLCPLPSCVVGVCVCLCMPMCLWLIKGTALSLSLTLPDALQRCPELADSHRDKWATWRKCDLM